MRLAYYEDYQVGQVLVSDNYIVDKTEIIEYAKKWDPQPFHIDEDAANASIFDGLTAPGAFFWAVASWLGNTIEPKMVALSALATTDVEFLIPIRPNDQLILKAVVTQKRQSQTKPDRGIVHFAAQLVNQHDETIFRYRSKVLMAKRNKPV